MNPFKTLVLSTFLSLSLTAGRPDLQPTDSMGIYQALITVGAAAGSIASLISWINEPEIPLPAVAYGEVFDDDNVAWDAPPELPLEAVEEDPLAHTRDSLRQRIIAGDHDGILTFLHAATLQDAPRELVIELLTHTLQAGLPQFAESIIMAANLPMECIPPEMRKMIRSFVRAQTEIPFIESTNLYNLPNNPTTFRIEAAFHAILSPASINQVAAYFNGQPILLDAYLNLTNNLQDLWSGRAIILGSDGGFEFFLQQYNELVEAFNDLHQSLLDTSYQTHAAAHDDSSIKPEDDLFEDGKLEENDDINEGARQGQNLPAYTNGEAREILEDGYNFERIPYVKGTPGMRSVVHSGSWIFVADSSTIYVNDDTAHTGPCFKKFKRKPGKDKWTRVGTVDAELNPIRK